MVKMWLCVGCYKENDDETIPLAILHDKNER